MHIKLSNDAEADLDAIKSYIEPRSPDGFQRVMIAIFTTLEQLESFPFLDRFTVTLNHLMLQISSSARQSTQRDAAHLASWLTLSGGLIWSTEGRLCTPAGRRYTPLVVIKTTARSVPSRQTSKTGQMIQCSREAN